MVYVESTLAMATIKSRAIGLNDGFDGTTAGQAWKIGAAVDLELMLKVAELTIGLNVIPKGRAAGLDGVAQDLPNSICEAPILYWL